MYRYFPNSGVVTYDTTHAHTHDHGDWVTEDTTLGLVAAGISHTFDVSSGYNRDYGVRVTVTRSMLNVEGLLYLKQIKWCYITK